MDKKLYMPEISENCFIESAGENGFFRRYGNPVMIRRGNGDGMVCMAAEYYERISGELRRPRGDGDTRYWIMEFEMSVETKNKLESIAKENEMTIDEFCEAALQAAARNPEMVRAACCESGERSDDPCEIRLVRQYPVHRGETEARARKRALAKEAAQAQREDDLLEQNSINPPLATPSPIGSATNGAEVTIKEARADVLSRLRRAPLNKTTAKRHGSTVQAAQVRWEDDARQEEKKKE